jgi:hypothetical protein
MGKSHPATQSDARVRAHRAAVTEKPPPGLVSPDYADAFEVAREPADQRSAERWARDGFEGLPLTARRSVLLAHRWILGFHLGLWESAEHVFGWRIATSEPELLHLEARSRLFSGHMVWRLHETRLAMTTFLGYEMPTASSLVWTAVGNVHRGGAPGLLDLAASAPGRADE